MTNREHYSEQIIDICDKGGKTGEQAIRHLMIHQVYGNMQNYTNRRQSK